jgi:hypothetical protein
MAQLKSVDVAINSLLLADHPGHATPSIAALCASATSQLSVFDVL